MSDLVPLEQRIENAIGVIKEMESAFLEIQQPRSAFVLEKFVVGQHDTLQTQYSQCVLELQRGATSRVSNRHSSNAKRKR